MIASLGAGQLLNDGKAVSLVTDQTNTVHMTIFSPADNCFRIAKTFAKTNQAQQRQEAFLDEEFFGEL